MVLECQLFALRSRCNPDCLVSMMQCYFLSFDLRRPVCHWLIGPVQYFVDGRHLTYRSQVSAVDEDIADRPLLGC